MCNGGNADAQAVTRHDIVSLKQEIEALRMELRGHTYCEQHGDES
jgi:hypothetical protein